MKNFFSNATLLFAIAVAVLTLRIAYLLLYPGVFSWDATVYIGMARYIESAGQLGLWEGYRPPLLPLLYTLGVMLNIPISFAIGLTIAASFGALYMAYTIGERYYPAAGGWTSIVLATSTLFSTFTVVPTTEVFGVLGFFVALYVVLIRRAYGIAGFVTGILFILRFPYGLLLPLFGISIVYEAWYQRQSFSVIIKRALYFTGGAFLVLVPYFVSNVFVFGDAFLPVFAGAKVAREVGFLYIESPFFYLVILLAGAPLLVFSLGLFSRFSYNAPGIKSVVRLLAITAALFFFYFTYEGHKEARYIMPALAPLVLLGGLGIATLFSRLQATRSKNILFGSIVVILIGSVIGLLLVPIGFIKDPGLESYYKTFRAYPGSTVFSATPAIVAFAPVRLIGSYTTIERYRDEFIERQDEIDHMYFNSCDLVQCQAGESCTVQTAALLDTLAPMVSLTTVANRGMCQIVIGETRQ